MPLGTIRNHVGFPGTGSNEQGVRAGARAAGDLAGITGRVGRVTVGPGGRFLGRES